MEDKEAQLSISDTLALEAKKAHGHLAEYIHLLRDSLDNQYAEYTRPEEAILLRQAIAETEKLLLCDNGDTTEETYAKRHTMLYSLEEPIANRHREAEELSKAILDLMKLIDTPKKTIRAKQLNIATINWLQDKLAQQNLLTKTADPILRLQDVEEKMQELVTLRDSISQEPKFSVTALDSTITELRKMVADSPDGSPPQPVYSYALGLSLGLRFERRGEINDINEAIVWLEVAEKLTPDNDIEKPSRLKSLAVAFVKRFDRFGDLASLNNAISNLEATTSCLSGDGPYRLEICQILGNQLYKRFERTDEIADLNNAITTVEQSVVPCMKNEDSNKPGFLQFLGDLLYKRFERLGNITDVNKAISILEDPLYHTLHGNPARPKRSKSLSVLFSKRFQRLGDIMDIEYAISNLSEAIHDPVDDVSDRPVYLYMLGTLFYKRFERLGEVVDIDNAISNLEGAVEQTPKDDPVIPDRLDKLGRYHLERFERASNPADVDVAITILENASNLTTSSHSAKSRILQNLASAYVLRSSLRDDITDVDKAILTIQDTVKTISDDDPEQLFYLVSLGTSYSSRFQQRGSIIDIDQAISLFEGAQRIIPTGHEKEGLLFSNLGICFHSRFERLEDPADLDKAIANLRKLENVTRANDMHESTGLASLGQCLSNRFSVRGGITDLNDAISILEAAINITPGRQSWHAFHTLGAALLKRFEQLGDPVDAEQGIAYGEKALLNTPDDPLRKPDLYSSIGHSYFQRFEKLGNSADLDRAISLFTDAVHTVSASNPRKTTYMNNLGGALFKRFGRNKDVADLRTLIPIASDASRNVVCPPKERFRAATLWAVSASICDDDSAMDAHALAIDLLPRMAWLGMTVGSQHRELTDASTAACDAAACALLSHECEKALAWLEQGRSVVWGQLLQLRTPLDDLHDADPELADRLQQVSAELRLGASRGPLAGPPSAGKPDASVEQSSQMRRRLADEWTSLVDQARRIERFENFMKPAPYDQLAEVSRTGPVVMLIVSWISCDALILPAPGQPLMHVPLQGFSHKRAEKLRQSLSSLLASGGIRVRHLQPALASRRPHNVGNSFFRRLLAELWECIVKPVLDRLDFKRIDADHQELLPRICWCPTGNLAFLPIHAAGLYNADGTESTVSLADFAISSYTPSLTALRVAPRSRPSQSSMQPFKLLVVTQPNTPRQPRLPSTTDELAYVRKHASTHKLDIHSLEGAAATVQEVSKAMDGCSWVHLACHGIQDTAEPTKSALLLQDGRLELSTIIEKTLPHADFAFLSACQTATGDEDRPDEAIHLAAGMLLAGYRGVTATMWSILDSDAPIVADGMYAELFRGGHPDSLGAARALHLAVRRLRQQKKHPSFFSWVPFIHVGA